MDDHRPTVVLGSTTSGGSALTTYVLVPIFILSSGMLVKSLVLRPLPLDLSIF